VEGIDSVWDKPGNTWHNLNAIVKETLPAESTQPSLSHVLCPVSAPSAKDLERRRYRHSEHPVAQNSNCPKIATLIRSETHLPVFMVLSIMHGVSVNGEEDSFKSVSLLI